MRLASNVTIAEGGETKQFSAEQFHKVMRSNFFLGAFAFWRSLERLAQSEERTRVHARGVLRALAQSQFEDCGGVAFSPQHAEAFRYCGFEPVRIAPPGELAW